MCWGGFKERIGCVMIWLALLFIVVCLVSAAIEDTFF